MTEPAALPDANSFAVQRARLSDGTELAFVREGKGGVPLLMLHGWPSTKRIFYRNIGPLAAAGFEVIAPDASGWGDSPASPHGYPDPVRSTFQFAELMASLGHDRWVLAAFDFGSFTALDMTTRFPARIIRQLLWNPMVPLLPEAYDRAGCGGNLMQENLSLSSHITDHGADPDAFAARFADDAARAAYVRGFYQGRVWRTGGPRLNLAGEGNFDDSAAAFHAAPFASAETFRASINYYAALLHPDKFFAEPMITLKVGAETMFLYGTADQIIGPIVTRRAEVAYERLVGPFLVDGGGHFLCWERPAVVNGALRCLCRDILPGHGS
ncbi:alpha/beta hydrolase [Sphingobium aquiterrae]|uniref:alpha/beta fold hydrolase n=1 Tax=Sphingobium aquiterrae TaxID=2038656 RepID=UPI003019CCBB